ncbi:hypothetical protein A2U01_0042920, partial [Trifolium medium]|nr:hypothetical protein [Trifolium medium]
MWNCKSSIFLPSFSELRNPALRCEKAESSGAKIVNPPPFAVMSCVESVSGEVGSVGTNGFDDVGDDAFGAGACFGDA